EYADFIWDDIRHDLSSNPPAIFVVSDDDFNWFNNPNADRQLPRRQRGGARARPAVPSSQRSEFETNVSAFLRTWLKENYERVDDVSCEEGVVYVYKRRDLIPPAPASAP